MKTISKTRMACFIVLLLMLLQACDILSDNPLILDGTTLDVEYIISTGEDETSFDESKSVDLQEILDDVEDNVEDISVYNITLRVYNLQNTPPSTSFTGTMSINGIQLLAVNNMPLSTFTTERTIFDSSLQAQGVTVSQAGINYLVMLMESQPLPVITARFVGNCSTDQVRFTVEAKIYTQVFTKP
jgi:hypothetical protein